MWVAARTGRVDLIEELIKAEANINQPDTKWGDTPLCMGAYHNHTDVVKYLLEARADPTIANKNGEGPMKWANTYKNRVIIRLLESYGG